MFLKNLLKGRYNKTQKTAESTGRKQKEREEEEKGEDAGREGQGKRNERKHFFG